MECQEQTDLCNELMAQALKAQEEGRTEEVGRCLFKVKMGQPQIGRAHV